MKHELSCSYIIKHSENFLELTNHEYTEVSQHHATEINTLINDIMKEPFVVLANVSKHCFFEFKASFKIGNSPYQKKTAILAGESMLEESLKTVKGIQKVSNTNKKVQIFNNREDALHWLEITEH